MFGNGIRYGLGSREVIEGEPGGVVLGLLGGSEGFRSVECKAVDCDGGGEARVVVQALLRDVVLW